MRTVDVIGLPVAVTTYSEAIGWISKHAREGDKAYLVEAANTHVAALARHEKDFEQVMSRFDLICPDGMPLLWKVNKELPREEKLKDRVYGPTLMLECIKASQGQTDLKHFFFGGKQSTLDKLNEKFSKEYPDANIVGSYSPPFGNWPDDEFEKICNLIKDSGANHIWVGLGCPKQERWMAKYKDNLPAGCYFGVGAAFAFHAGEIKQAPQMIQNMGMEWAYRMFREPRRLLMRYVKFNSLFLYYLLRN